MITGWTDAFISAWRILVNGAPITKPASVNYAGIGVTSSTSGEDLTIAIAQRPLFGDKAICAAEYSVIYTPNLKINYQSEAWNNGTQTHPVLARTSTGLYTLTFASSYVVDGVTTATVLNYVTASAMHGLDDLVIVDAAISGLVVTIRIRDILENFLDLPFVVKVG